MVGREPHRSLGAQKGRKGEGEPAWICFAVLYQVVIQMPGDDHLEMSFQEGG